MTENEKRTLKKVIEHSGFITSSVLEDPESIESLIIKGYIEEVPRDMGRYTVIFYRATEKGLFVFIPWHVKIWSGIKGDIRTVVIVIITALITTLIAIFLEKFLR